MKKNRYFTYETGLGIIGGLTVAFAVVFFIRMFSPIICQRAVEKLQSQFNRICNEAVLDYIESEKVNYNDIIITDRGEDGKILGMTTDIAKVNHMKSVISLEIQKQLDKIDEIKVEVPTGGFFGLGGGIDIPVLLMSVGHLETEIVSSFESVGINQTRLCLTAVVNMKGKLLAIGEGSEVEIRTEIPVLMTVVVGDVPGTYVNVKK